MNTNDQPASTSDGMGNGKLKGQKEAIHQGNNPSGLSGIKETRKTGEVKQGTQFLRNNVRGYGNDGESA